MVTSVAPLLMVLQAGSAAAVGSPPAPAAVFRSVVPVIYVRDVRRSAAFYRDVLGFDLQNFIVGSAQTVRDLSKTDDPYGADFSVAGQSISLQRAPGTHASGARLDIVVDDLTAYHRRLVGLGVKVHKFTKPSNGGVFCFSVFDPDRHEILFLQRQEKPQ